jgi:hypothetical protein
MTTLPRSAAGKPGGRIRGPGPVARVQPAASYVTISRMMDGRRAGRPHRPHSPRTAPMPQMAKPRAGLSSGQQIVNPASHSVTGADLHRHRHQPSRSAWFRHAAGMIKPFRPPLNQRLPWSGTTGRRAAVTAGARRSPRSAPTPVAPSRSSRPRRTAGRCAVIETPGVSLALRCSPRWPRRPHIYAWSRLGWMSAHAAPRMFIWEAEPSTAVADYAAHGRGDACRSARSAGQSVGW